MGVGCRDCGQEEPDPEHPSPHFLTSRLLGPSVAQIFVWFSQEHSGSGVLPSSSGGHVNLAAKYPDDAGMVQAELDPYVAFLG